MCISNEPFNRENQHLFIQARSAYKKTCRKAEKLYRDSLTKKLMNIGQNDPKTFWDIISKMNKWGKGNSDPTENISAKSWHAYFEKLLNDNTEKIAHTPTGEQCSTFDPMLDGIIKDQELKDALL